MKKIEEENKKEIKEAKTVKKVSKKPIKKEKKKDSVKLNIFEVFGYAFIVLVFAMVLCCFYYFLTSEKKDVILENRKYVSYDGGSLSVSEAFEDYQDDSFNSFMDKLDYELVLSELSDDDKDEVDENVDKAVDDLNDYYSSTEELNYAISIYTGYKDIDEYKEKYIKKSESINKYVLNYCDNEDVSEDLCNKYIEYYTKKALFDLRNDKNIKFKVGSAKDKYDNFVKDQEDELKKLKSDMEKAEEGFSNIVSLTYSELDELITNKENFIAVITQTGCGHCEAYLPNLNEVLVEKEMVAVQINITDYSEEEVEKLGKLVEFEGTPTTALFKNGKLSGKTYEGNMEKDKIEEMLDKFNK